MLDNDSAPHEYGRLGVEFALGNEAASFRTTDGATGRLKEGNELSVL